MENRERCTETTEAPEIVQKEYARLYRQRRTWENPESWYIEYDPDRAVLSYCGPFVSRQTTARRLDAWVESGPFGRLARTGFWTNGAAVLRDTGEFPYLNVIRNPEAERAVTRTPEQSDAVQDLLLLYDPWIHPYPLAYSVSFGLCRVYDSRYLDVAETLYGPGEWRFEVVSDQLFYFTPEGLQAVICPVRPPESTQGRIAQLLARRRDVCGL